MGRIFRQAKTKSKLNRFFVPLVGIDDDWLDAFGRLRVSNTATLFEASFSYDTQPLLFESTETNGGTVVHNAESKCLILTSGTQQGSMAAVQSRVYVPYEKGKSQLIKMTGIIGPPTSGAVSRIGYFDSNDGFYWQQSDQGMAIVRRSSVSGSVVETVIPQSEWNVDPLDGSGDSKIELDATKSQILFIDGQWLGVGRVRVGFNINGSNYIAHEFLHANVVDFAPYIRTFTLPVRYETSTIEEGTGGSLTAICCDVESEGGVDSPTGFNLAASNSSDVSTSTSSVAVLSIRPSSEYPEGSGQTNRSFIVPVDTSVLVGGQPCIVELMYDAELSGGTWERANDNSAVDFGIGQSIENPGIVIDSFFVESGSGNTRSSSGEAISSQYPLTLNIEGLEPKALTIVARTLSGTGTIRAAMSWREIR